MVWNRQDSAVESVLLTEGRIKKMRRGVSFECVSYDNVAIDAGESLQLLWQDSVDSQVQIPLLL